MNLESATVAHEFAHVQGRASEMPCSRRAELAVAQRVEDGLARAQRTCVRAGASTAPCAASGATNAELDALAFDLKITNYVRCRMKDELRGQTATASECGIVNLQNADQAGSHWVLYFKDLA